MARFYVHRWYQLSLSGSGNKSTKYDVRDSTLSQDTPAIKTFSDKKKADEMVDRLNRQAADNEREVKTLGTVAEKPETEVDVMRKKAAGLGFKRYRIRRYRYYLHLTEEEGMTEKAAQDKAAAATRHELWPYRLTREQLAAAKQ